MDISAVLARNISIRLNDLGITQRDLALEIGVSEAYISRLMSSRTWIAKETLTDIARALKTTVSELFIETRNPKSLTRDLSIKDALDIINQYEGLLTIKLRKLKK